jgi:peptidoglycan/LPS O-acetylase OafA/YrhL
MPDSSRFNKQHIPQVDYIRAVASLSVALFHLGGKALPILNYGWLGVQMFFLLSGFIICWSIPDDYNLKMAKTFLAKRLIRIEPPYILSIALLLIVHSFVIPGFRPDWQNVAFHFAYLNSFFDKPYLNPVYWTLGIEFQFYLLIAFIFPLIIKKYGVLVILGLSVIPLLINVPAIRLSGFFPGFAIGICYYLIKKQSFDYKLIATLVTLILLSFIIQGWLPTAAALVALCILMLPLRANKIVKFFSKISFSLYLTHDIIGSSYVVKIGSLLPKTVPMKGFEFLSGILISIGFAYLFYRLIEKPFFQLSKQISYRTLQPLATIGRLV